MKTPKVRLKGRFALVATQYIENPFSAKAIWAFLSIEKPPPPPPLRFGPKPLHPLGETALPPTPPPPPKRGPKPTIPTSTPRTPQLHPPNPPKELQQIFLLALRRDPANPQAVALVERHARLDNGPGPREENGAGKKMAAQRNAGICGAASCQTNKQATCLDGCSLSFDQKTHTRKHNKLHTCKTSWCGLE